MKEVCSHFKDQTKAGNIPRIGKRNKILLSRS
jgi:hypothetical protein